MYEILNWGFEKSLELSALVLSIVNALILVWFFFRDKPNLVIKPVYPNVYQWWFKLPSRQYNGEQTRRFGFLIYVGIANKGLRKTTLDEWCLLIRLKNYKKTELKPLNIPQPQLKIGNQEKFYNVLGQVGTFSDGITEIDSGSSISGMVFYTFECYGSEVWNPKINDEEIIKANFKVREVFGKSTKTKIELQKKTIPEIEEFIPNFMNFLRQVESQA